MAKLFIPQVGNKLKLIANWDCKVFNEYRNRKVFDGLNVDVSGEGLQDTNIDITFPKGTVLKVDRLYVRAPASSYDSITFTVDSSPIKSLNKARFWVKLMDANKIEFEEINLNIDYYKKLKDVYRFVSLSNDFQNSERLSLEDANFVCKEIHEHFNKKNNNLLTVKLTLTLEEYFKTISFPFDFLYFQRSEVELKRKEYFDKLKEIYEPIEVTVNMLPVLDGWIFSWEANQQAIKMDTHLGLHGEVVKQYMNTSYLGSYLSRTKSEAAFAKSLVPAVLNMQWKQLDSLDFEYQGKTIKFKNEKEYEKFVKSIRVTPTKN